MPLFEFTCRKCGHVFEEILSLADLEEGVPACPSCGSPRTERALSTFNTGSAGSEAPCGAPAGSCGTGGFT
jgi:putative FmdB family regulatory protein